MRKFRKDRVIGVTLELLREIASEADEAERLRLVDVAVSDPVQKNVSNGTDAQPAV